MSTNIISTKDYNQFKILDGQRPVVQSRVDAIVKSIKEKNLLHLFPLLINKKKEVIDGQHRLEAAKILQCPIFYFVDPDLDDCDVMRIHANRHNWTTEDHVNFYASKKKDDYIFLKDMIIKAKHYKCPISCLFEIITKFCYKERHGFFDHIRNGTLKLKNHNTAISFVLDNFDNCVKINGMIYKQKTKKMPEKLFFSATYIYCLCSCYEKMNREEFKEFWRCLFTRFDQLTHTKSTTELANKFEYIYNFSKRSNRLNFNRIWPNINFPEREK